MGHRVGFVVHYVDGYHIRYRYHLGRDDVAIKSRARVEQKSWIASVTKRANHKRLVLGRSKRRRHVRRYFTGPDVLATSSPPGTSFAGTEIYHNASQHQAAGPSALDVFP